MNAAGLTATLVATACCVAAVAAEDLAQARALFDRGEYDVAAATLTAWLDAHPGDLDARVLLGWCRYRAGEFEDARLAFEATLVTDPGHHDARVGLGYARLQQGEPESAAGEFERVLARKPDDRDALRGLLLAARRADGGAVPVERRLRAVSDERADPRVAVRAGHDYLQIRGEDGRWVDLFVKGFNLGVALPGRFPTQFPEDEATYESFLGSIADLGANAVRVYTLLPPAFYRALARHNATPGARRLWLLQGVWTELPPRHDFDDAVFVESFEAEIARVIDAVHGNLALGPRPGHAWGLYETDASGSLLALLVGREWEPFAVVDHNALHPGEQAFRGRWLEVERAPAMERWVARMCDFAVGYEVERYGTLRPVSFANWPTLDPLEHPTESNRDEEDRIRDLMGIGHPAELAEAPWEDDRVSLDATRIRPTARNAAGFFASYHIYPNFPDFMNLEPAYAEARDREGPSRYAGYLRALKRYHGDQPVLVAEFGISTSRGIAHLQPQGWHHGGHDERGQGELVARMLRSIHDERYAGGIVFEFLDEWFKGTWSSNPLEVPRERARLWFNAESPEQSYGVMAARPDRAAIRVNGDPADWNGIERLGGYDRAAGDGSDGWNDLRGLRVTFDEGYVYLLIETAARGGTPHQAGVGLRLAIDTYRADRGGSAGGLAPTGAEFLVEIDGPAGSRVSAIDGYDPYEAVRTGRPLASPALPEGRGFVPLRLETNRERFGRDGARYPARYVERGRLDYGSVEDLAVGGDHGVIELRLPWSLLNVADPSARRVLHDERGGGPPFGTVETEGFRFYLTTGEDRLPAAGTVPAPWRWDTWEQPAYVLELKRGAPLIREAMRALPDTLAGDEP